MEKRHTKVTRQEAISEGLKFYSGKACKNCKSTKKYVSSRSCFRCSGYNGPSYQKFIKFLWAFKNNPCRDCGITYHPVAMQFDHVRGTKKFEVGLANRKSRKSILKELKKCELVCANCHALRTYTRKKGNQKCPK